MKKRMMMAGMVLLAAGCGKKPEDLGGKSAPGASDKDNKFLATVTESNTTEIRAGALVTASQNQSVKDFGKMLVDDHTKAAAQVATLAASLSAKPPTDLDSDHLDLLKDLDGKTGIKFDKAFLKGQIKAHEDTIKAADDEAMDGTNPQLKQLAADLKPTLQKHLDEAKMLKEQVEKMEKDADSATTKPAM